jgi:hypothetical protein
MAGEGQLVYGGLRHGPFWEMCYNKCEQALRRAPARTELSPYLIFRSLPPRRLLPIPPLTTTTAKPSNTLSFPFFFLFLFYLTRFFRRKSRAHPLGHHIHRVGDNA